MEITNFFGSKSELSSIFNSTSIISSEQYPKEYAIPLSPSK